MPEAVKIWTPERGFEAMQTALFNIISTYERDFAKHPDVREFQKIALIWGGPGSTGKEHRKFIYNVVKEGTR
jgi:hypothetical protein